MTALQTSRFAFLLTLAAALAAPPLLDAQGIGGRIRNTPAGRAVERNVTRDTTPQEAQRGRANAPAEQASARPQGRPNVLELNGDVLDRFERAMAREAQVRVAYVRQQEAAQARQQERAQCTMRVMMSEAHEKLMDRISAAAEKNDGPALRRLGEEQQKMITDECGSDGDPGSGYMGTREFEREASDAGDFTDVQYAVIKERIVPFCRANVAADPNGVRLPGAGQGWVYSGVEAQALKPRCGTLMRSLDGLL